MKKAIHLSETDYEIFSYMKRTALHSNNLSANAQIFSTDVIPHTWMSDKRNIRNRSLNNF